MIVQKKGEGTTTYSNALEAAGFKMFLFKFNAHFNKGGGPCSNQNTIWNY